MTLRDFILKQEREHKPDRVVTGPDPVKQQELHEKILSGEIDIGPFPDHSAPVKNLIPKYSGEEAWLLHIASRNGHSRGHDRDLSQLWDFDK